MWRLISTKAYRVRLPRAARVRTPDVPVSSCSGWTDVEGFHHYCLCTSFALVSSCWRSFPLNVVTVNGNAHESRAPPSVSSKSHGNSAPFKIQFMWRGLMKKSSDYQTLPSSWVSFFLSAVPDCPAGSSRGSGGGAEPSVAGSNHLLAHLTMLTLSCLFGKMVV